jgi:hypothetical protein
MKEDEMRKLIIICLFLIYTTVLIAQTEQPVIQEMARAQVVSPDWGRTVSNQAFQEGEELDYKAKIGPFTVGSAKFFIPTSKQFKDRSCLVLVSEIRSSDTFSKIFFVNDRVESWVDKKGLFPWYFEKYQHEGSYTSQERVYLDHPDEKAFTMKDTLDMIPYTQDILSIIYFIRSQELEPGHKFTAENLVNGELYPLDIFVRDIERKKVPAGKFETIKVEPKYRPGFEKKPKGEMVLWLSTDHRKLPVQIKTKLAFGSLNMELETAKGLSPKELAESRVD